MSRDDDKPRIRIESTAEGDARYEQLLRQAVMRLPLSDAEKAEAVRRLLAGKEV